MSSRFLIASLFAAAITSAAPLASASGYTIAPIPSARAQVRASALHSGRWPSGHGLRPNVSVSYNSERTLARATVTVRAAKAPAAGALPERRPLATAVFKVQRVARGEWLSPTRHYGQPVWQPVPTPLVSARSMDPRPSRR